MQRIFPLCACSLDFGSYRNHGDVNFRAFKERQNHKCQAVHKYRYDCPSPRSKSSAKASCHESASTRRDAMTVRGLVTHVPVARANFLNICYSVCCDYLFYFLFTAFLFCLLLFILRFVCLLRCCLFVYLLFAYRFGCLFSCLLLFAFLCFLFTFSCCLYLVLTLLRCSCLMVIMSPVFVFGLVLHWPWSWSLRLLLFVFSLSVRT